MTHTVKGFSIVNEAEVDVFLEFPCFLYDPMKVGNLISGSSSFSKSSLYIWKFLVHILLKPNLKDFEQDGRVIVESSDKMWSTGGGNSKPLQCSCLENPMDSMKRQKNKIAEDELPRLEGIQYATGEERRAVTNSSRKNEVAREK